MDTRVFFTLLLVTLARSQDLSFDCESLRPSDQTAVEQHSFAPFAIWTSDSFVGKGEPLTVTLKRMHIGGSMSPLKSFVVQARLIGKTYPIGTWEIQEGVPAKGHNCPGGTHGLNTLSSLDYEAKEQDIIVTWRAPADLSGSVEFLGTFVRPDNTYFFNINSIEVDLAVKEGDAAPTNDDGHRSPGVYSNTDPHQSLKEAELAARFKDNQMQEIQNEDKYSEGDWQRREEEERRQHQENRKEMEMYEKQKADEDRIRMERIRAEMLDKEEHDRQAWENEHKGEGSKGDSFDQPQNDDNIINLNEDDTDTVNAKATTSGATVVTSGVLAAILAAIVFARRN